MDLIRALFVSIRALSRSRSALIIENLALRHQLTVLQRSVNGPSCVPEIESSGSGYLGYARRGVPTC